MELDPSTFEYSVAIFTARETPATLEQCIRATVEASNDSRVIVNILVNGNRTLADDAVKMINRIKLPDGICIRVWFIQLGDKAHAWNEYLFHIAPSVPHHFFVDGYVMVRPDAYERIRLELEKCPSANAASGVPSIGRSAHKLRGQMLREGGLHGNLYALPERTMEQFRLRDFRLPLGIYRNDSLIASVLCFGLDPATHQWDIKRILVVPDATWWLRPTSTFSAMDLLTHLRRTLRQAQGRLENLAIKAHLAKRRDAPELIPRTVAELIDVWAETEPQEFKQTLRRHPSSFHALYKMRQPKNWSAAKLVPQLLWASAVQCEHVVS